MPHHVSGINFLILSVNLMNKAPGVDLVGTNMLVELADEISGTISDLFNKSLRSGEAPPDWKLANVSPIFIKGRNQVCPIIDLLV